MKFLWSLMEELVEKCKYLEDLDNTVKSQSCDTATKKSLTVPASGQYHPYNVSKHEINIG